MPDISSADRDAIVRTVIGEAATEPPEGQAGVAHVILNRLNSGNWGSSARNIVFAPGEFEPWSTRRRELLAISPKSPQYQQAAQIVDGVLAGKISDPTGGADHFLNPATVRARTGTVPDWAQGVPAAIIGGHSFYQVSTPDYLGQFARSAGKKQNAAPAQDTGERDWLSEFARSAATPSATPAVTTISIPRRALPGEVVPATTPPADETPAQYTNRILAEHQGSGLGEIAIRAGAGVMRGVGDVADTLAQGITGAGRQGANALASAGVIAPQTAAGVGDWANRVQRDIATDNAAFEQAAAQSPSAQIGRVGGQILGTGPFAEAALPARALAGASPLVRATVGGAAAGGTSAALTSAASDEPLSTQIGTGALAGAALGPLGAVGRGARRLVLGSVDPETAQLAQAARDVHGIPVTAGQISLSPAARFMDSVLQRLPFSGYASRTAEQQTALNRAVASEMGVASDKVTPDVIRGAKRTAYADYDAAKAQIGDLSLDQKFYGSL
jgi:hypothetical protein